MKRWRGWLAAAGLMLCALTAFGEPTQNQTVDIDRLRVKAELLDESPLPMIILGADHHGCREWPFTIALAEADEHRIPIVPYISRDPAATCTGAELTDARLQAVAASRWIEVGNHGARHVSLPLWEMEGRIDVTSGSATITGIGTTFSSSTDVRKVIYIPAVRTTPFLITAVTNTRQITVSPTPATTARVAKYLMAGTLTSAGADALSVTNGSAVVTCSTCSFTSLVFGPLAGGPYGKGSMVVIEASANNPYHVSTVDSATQLTLDQTVDNTTGSYDFAVVDWIELVGDAFEVGRAEIVSDSGCTGCAVSWGAPSNASWPFMHNIFRRLGIDSVAATTNGPFNSYGAHDFRQLDRITWDARIGPEGARNFARAASESDGMFVVNFEQMYAASYSTGTVSLTNGSNTVTCAGGCNWDGLGGPGEPCDTDSDCWLFVEDSTEAKAYRISTFDTSTQLTLDPVDSGFDVDSTPGVTVSGSTYWIADPVTIGLAGTGCRTPSSACNGITDKSLHSLLIWLDANRDKVTVVNQRDGVRRAARLSSSPGMKWNLVANPRFRVGRAEMLPPGNTNAATGVMAFFNWLPSWAAGPNANTTLTASSSGELTLTSTDGVAQLLMTMPVLQREMGATYTFGFEIDMSAVTAVGDMRSSISDAGTFNAIDTSTNLINLPVSGGAWPLGSERGFAFVEYQLSNTGFMSATFDCTPEPCGEAQNVHAPAPLQASSPVNALPDPFVIDDTSGTAGVYTITYEPLSFSPVVFVQSLTTLNYCSTGAVGISSIVVTCKNDAGVGVDTDFRIVVYESQLPAFTQQLAFRIGGRMTGTTKWASPMVIVGGTRTGL